MQELEVRASQLRTRMEFGAFLEKLADSLMEKPESWENDSLERFLRAWAAWLGDMEGNFANQGKTLPEEPTWQLVAQMLLAAKIYE